MYCKHYWSAWWKRENVHFFFRCFGLVAVCLCCSFSVIFKCKFWNNAACFDNSDANNEAVSVSTRNTRSLKTAKQKTSLLCQSSESNRAFRGEITELWHQSKIKNACCHCGKMCVFYNVCLSRFKVKVFPFVPSRKQFSIWTSDKLQAGNVTDSCYEEVQCAQDKHCCLQRNDVESLGCEWSPWELSATSL